MPKRAATTSRDRLESLFFTVADLTSEPIIEDELRAHLQHHNSMWATAVSLRQRFQAGAAVEPGPIAFRSDGAVTADDTRECGALYAFGCAVEFER